MEQEIAGVLARIKPSLGGADVRLRGVSRGVVTVRYSRPPSNPSACHVDRTRATKEIVAELLEERLQKVVPGFRELVLLDED
jgi:hypothetical protein